MRRRSSPHLVYALYANAALLAVIATVLLSRPSGGNLALAAPPAGQQIAGGGGVYLMPAQFSINTWGCYVMDIDKQTLCAYQYIPGQNQLRLVASRWFRFDRDLKAYNTGPSPEEVEHLVQLEQNAVRGKEPPVAPTPVPDAVTPTPEKQ